jgi:hypothetical protein
MESPSVRGKVGSHIAHWCNNPEKELKEAIVNSLSTGLLRLEITFYRKGERQHLTQDFVEEQMDFLEGLIPPDLLHYNPISNQYALLLERVHSNICVVDTDKSVALFSLYFNKETGKTNGFYMKEATSNKISNILKYYTFDVPIVVLLLKRNGETVQIQQDTYLRQMEVGRKTDALELITYIPKGETHFRQHTLAEGEVQPPERGLLDNPKVRLRIQTTKQDLNKLRTHNINISLSTVANIHLEFPAKDNTVRTVNREVKENNTLKLFATNPANVEAAKQLEDRNKRKTEELAEADRIIVEETRRRTRISHNTIAIFKAYKTGLGNAKRFMQIEDGTKLWIYAAKQIDGKFGMQYLLLASTTDSSVSNAALFTIYATKPLHNFIESMLDIWSKLGGDIYCSLQGEVIMLVKKTGFYYVKENKCPKVEIMEYKKVDPQLEARDTSSIVLDCIEKRKELVMQEKQLMVKDCVAIDSIVAVGDSICIKQYWLQKKSVLCVIQVNGGEDKNVLCNPWLNDLIRTRVGDRQPILELLVAPKREHPASKRSCFTFATGVANGPKQAPTQETGDAEEEEEEKEEEVRSFAAQSDAVKEEKPKVKEVKEEYLEEKYMSVQECLPIDKLINVGDKIRIKYYSLQKKAVLCSIEVKGGLSYNALANPWLNEMLRAKINEEQQQPVLELVVACPIRHPILKKSFLSFELEE